MADERIIVEFTTQGLPETQQGIDDLQNNAIGGFTELNSQLELFQGALAGLQGVAGALYGALIDSNERLNAELLKSQVSLAGTLDIYKDGVQMTDVTDKILSSAGTLKDSLKQIEKDTTELVGVTTEQVNGVFQILLQNANSFIGQSKEFSNPIDAATNATKGWVAALGTLGLPLEQANQEIRSILQGDVNNPDSMIAKTLAITKEQYDLWVANGELIDRINEKLDVYVKGNKLASQSVGAITANIQGFFEDTARMAGEPLLGPVVESLDSVYQLLLQNKDLIEELAQENVADLVSLFDTLRQSVAKVAASMNINPEGILKDGSELIGNLIAACEGLIRLGTSVLTIFGPGLTQALGNTFTAISFGLEGIAKLANLLTVAGDALGGFMKAANLGGGLDLGKVFDNAQASIAKLSGEYDQATEATATYRDITATLTAQADKIASSGNASSAMVKGQIDALNEQKEALKGLKTFRDEDKVSQEAQIAAVEKSIKALEGLKSSTDELTFKAPELQKLGTMMELLGKNADSAIATLGRDGGGKKEVFEEAAKSLTELTQKQVEYGQITAKEGITRLDAVVNNTKLELETREAALEAMKGLEKEFTDFKVAQLDLEAQAVDRKIKQGALSALEGAKASADITKQQSDVQIASLDNQIKKAEELGQSTTKLTQEREELLSKQADAELATLEKVGEIREQDQEQAYQKAISTVEETETQRLLALEKGLAAKKVSEESYNQQTLDATKERLSAELEAEQANLSQLEALLSTAGTADQKEALEAKVAESKKKTMDLQLQATKAEVEGQKAVTKAQEDAVRASEKAMKDRLEAVKDSYKKSTDIASLAEGTATVKLKEQLAARTITQEQYSAKVAQVTKTRLDAELAANQEQITKLSAIAANTKDNKGAQEELTAAKQRQIAITQQLLDLDISGQKLSAEAVKKAMTDRVEAVEKSYQATIGKATESEGQATLALKKGLVDRTLTQGQYDNRVLESRRTRLQAEVAAENEAVAKLSSIKATGKDQEELQDKIAAAKGRSRKATEELLDIELNAKDKIVDAYKTQLDEKMKGIDIEFSEREAKIRQTEKNETQSAVKLAQVNIERIRAQMAAEQEAADKLAALGDTKGAADKKLEVRKLAIGLIDAEIKAEEALQNVLKAELDLLRKRLDLKKGAQDVNLLQEELKLAEAVKAGTITKEQAEKRKLEIARARIEAELQLLQGLEGKGDEATQQKNTQDQLKAKIQLAELDKQISDVGKDQTKNSKEQVGVETKVKDVLKDQQDTIKRNAELRLGSLESQKADLAQLVALTELEAQSVGRVAQLREAQGGLINAQLASLETGLGNELSLVNAALSARTKLTDVEKKLATDTKLTAEQRVALEKEAVALKAQLGALGNEGNKTELELLEQRQAAEQAQITVKRQQLALSQEMAAIELENQKAAIALDKVRADFKAKELELEAQKLDIQADQLAAQAGLTKDAGEAQALAAQSANLKKQAGRTRELSDAQLKAAAEEAKLREALLETQAKVGELQAKSQEDTLNTQQKLLDSQQAYERSIKGMEAKVNTKSVDEFAKKIKDIKDEIKKVATVSLPTLKLTPGNIEVKVKDDRTVAPLNAIQRSSKVQTELMGDVKRSVAPLAGKLDAVTRAVKAIEVGKGGSVDTTVKNQITVTVVGGGPKPQVTVKDLIENRKKEGGCK